MIPSRDFKKLIRQLNLYGFSNYQEFLASDLWKEFRKVVERKTIKSCSSCKTGFGENLHHRSYKRLLDPTLVVWLCKDCHKKIHIETLKSIDEATKEYVKSKKTRVGSLRILDSGLPETLHHSLHASGVVSRVKEGEDVIVTIKKYYDRKVSRNDKLMVQLLEDNYDTVVKYIRTFTTR